MAEIAPFRAWRYNPETGPIEELISLLSYESEILYQNQFNSIQLSFPKTASEIKILLNKWKSKDIIKQDSSPSIYVYYQYYTADNTQTKCLKGFICNIKIQDFEEHIILRHEDTLSESMQNRLEVLEETEMNLCPTHGLYSDQELHMEFYMDECIKHSVYEFTDRRGIHNKVGIINDPNIIEIFKTHLKLKQIIIADGHHRYSASLEYQKKLLLKNNNFSTDHPANYHCMYLSNTESNDINILPTYRLIKNIKNFNGTDFIKKLKENFSIQLIDSSNEINYFLNTNINSIGILLNNTTIVATLKSKNTSDWNTPDDIKELDVAIAEHFIFQKILGLSPKDQKNISFETNLFKTFEYLNTGDIQIAIITKPISIDEVKSICYKGLTLPYKSTYFYPKVLCGIVFSSLNK